MTEEQYLALLELVKKMNRRLEFMESKLDELLGRKRKA
jgi:hypothetical protein